MNRIGIKICNAGGGILACEKGNGSVNLVYSAEYNEGDIIALESPENSFLLIQLDDVLEPALVYMKQTEFVYKIPFGEKRFSYNPKTFAGPVHLLRARLATAEECALYRNLACNSHDTASNTACFPHVSANIETRGESVFAARNAIDGNTENRKHGNWPYESWGINKDPSAELTLDFGRMVTVDKLVLVTRSDFPHDNYWTQAEACFSDGSVLKLYMEKSEEPHVWTFPVKIISGLKLGKLVQDKDDPSPFPALTQIEVFGKEAE